MHIFIYTNIQNLCNYFYWEIGSALQEVWPWRYRHKHVCWEVISSLGTCVLACHLSVLYYSFHNKLKCNPAYLNSQVNKSVDNISPSHWKGHVFWLTTQGPTVEEESGRRGRSQDVTLAKPFQLKISRLNQCTRTCAMLTWINAIIRIWRMAFGTCKVRVDNPKMATLSAGQTQSVLCQDAASSAPSLSVAVCVGIQYVQLWVLWLHKWPLVQAYTCSSDASQYCL